MNTHTHTACNLHTDDVRDWCGEQYADSADDWTIQLVTEWHLCEWCEAADTADFFRREGERAARQRQAEWFQVRREGSIR